MSISHKIRRAYDSQRYKAGQRGIKMSFTLEEWVEWWETQLGPNWFSKRGCTKGKYVMARNHDRGAYERTNVKCILASENVSEAGVKRIGVKAGNVRLTKKDILRIRNIKNLFDREIAAQYGVSRTHINAIRLGLKWKHI